MPKEIDPTPAQVKHPAAPAKSAGKNLRMLHQVDSYPVGHVLAPHEVPGADDRARAANVQRLLAIGAVAETDDPASGPLDASALPPGAAVTNQLSPGDELPPNALEPVDPARDKAIAEANAKAIAEQSGGGDGKAKGGK